jgi:hypothetical protein
MIPNCQGCKWELDEAYRAQEQDGLHLATCKDMLGSENIGCIGHFYLMMVDDKGKLKMW